MIYMVDHVYTDPATEAEWHAWYRGYLRKLVSVPGIHSAQRFKALDCTPSRYLAMYSVESADVFTSEPYRQMGGGGSQSVRFHPSYRLWTRNLFVAAPGTAANAGSGIRAPAVEEGQRVLVFDRDSAERDGALEAQATWLASVGLHMTTRYRAFIVLDPNAAAAAAVEQSFRYEPFTPVIS